jgi:hypothetical protein
MPGQTRRVLPSSSLGLPIVRQSLGAVDVWLLLNVWAFAGETGLNTVPAAQANAVNW